MRAAPLFLPSTRKKKLKKKLKKKAKGKKKRLLSKVFGRTFWHARQQYQAVLHLEQRSSLPVSPQFPGENKGEKEARERE